MISSHHTSPRLGVYSSLELLESICTYDDLRIWNWPWAVIAYMCDRITASICDSVTQTEGIHWTTEADTERSKKAVSRQQSAMLTLKTSSSELTEQHGLRWPAQCPGRAPDDECCNTSIPLALLIHTTAPDSGTHADTGQTIPTYLQHSVTDSFSDLTHDEFHFLAFPACHSTPALRTPEAMGTRRQRFLLFPAHFSCFFTVNKMNVFCSFVFSLVM